MAVVPPPRHQQGTGNHETAAATPSQSQDNNGGFIHKYQEGGQYGPVMNAKNHCTRVCGNKNRSSVCSTTLLVDIAHVSKPGSVRALCIVDDQSNASFCDPSIVKHFGIHTVHEDYDLTTMNGTFSYKGESVEGLRVKGAFTDQYYDLPALLTHPEMPTNKNEVTTKRIIEAHPHLASYASHFPHDVEDFDVKLLIGANCGELMFVRGSLGAHAPYIRDTPLGLSVVGPVCTTEPHPLKAFRTSVAPASDKVCTVQRRFVPQYSKEKLTSPFETRDDDNLTAMSQENTLFYDILQQGICVNNAGNIQMDLPLKPDAEIPDNKWPVFYRTKNTLARLKRNKKELDSSLKVMGEYIEAGHVEQVSGGEKIKDMVNYIPIFPVYSESKDKTRLVFDSSASVHGKSLNSALLPGIDEGSKLIGVLLRFRRGEYGFSADINKMFHCFYVSEKFRNLLRFWWFQDNDPSKDLCEYRANVMIFGNCASPACANFGIRYAAMSDIGRSKPMSSELLLENMYVDDLLASKDTVGESVEALSGCVDILAQYNIRLHKFSASDRKILSQFPESKCASTDVDIQPGEYDARVLGIRWSSSSDTLSLSSSVPSRPFTKRGLLAVIHSVYDPLGWSSPCLLKAKLLQREIMPAKKDSCPELESYDWDDALPEKYFGKWSEWIESLQGIRDIIVPRCYKGHGFGEVAFYEIHTFADASKHSIGHCIYLRSVGVNGKIAVALVFASSKVSPRSAETIPRLELTSAMDAVHSTIKVAKELDIPLRGIYYYTDSLITLGYLRNTSQRFSRYVARRVEEILRYSNVSQWSHISGRHNVGDIATKPHNPQELLQTDWLVGPEFLREGKPAPSAEESTNSDVELPETQEVKSLCIHKSSNQASLCEKVSKYTGTWTKAIFMIKCWIKLSRILSKRESLSEPDLSEKAKLLLFKEVQLLFKHQISMLQRKGELPKDDKLASLSPFIDQNGILRVGGRLRHSDFPADVAHPILLPADHPITRMILLHCHRSVSHQGRVLTHGAIRMAGFHILHASRVIKSFIGGCTFCRRLRGKPQEQVMADLPEDRLVERTASFSIVGLDMAGPFYVHDGKSTRRTAATKKVYILLITCLTSRAIHVEVVASMDTNSFILALRRFFALRGTVSRIYSDCGGNFIGAINNVADIERIQSYVASTHNISWVLNPPRASNYGGIFERKIACLKSIFNSTLKLMGRHHLSREEFSTFMQEAVSTVNATPLWSVSNHPDDPAPLCPANLLTLKDHPNPPPIESFSKEDLFQGGKRRWRRVLYLGQQFWVRWKKHYLLELQERNRWRKPNKNIKVGDLVLIKGKSKRNQWPLGRIKSTQLSKDGLVRRVLIHTVSKEGKAQVLERSVRDTVFLSHCE